MKFCRQILLAIFCLLCSSVALGQSAPFVPDDPYFFSSPSESFNGQWYLDKQLTGAAIDMNVQGAWEQGLTGEGIVVGVLEGAFEYTHPDLAANYESGFSWDFVDNDSDPRDTTSPLTATGLSSHATSVAGILGARGGNGIGVTGVAPRLAMASLRFHEGAGVPNNNTTLVNALSNAIAYRGGEIDVKNLSFAESSGRYAALMYPAVRNMEQSVRSVVSQGTIFVQGAGNARADANKLYIAHLPETIVVAAAGSNGRFSTYSNYGANIFVTAPSAASSVVTPFDVVTTDGTGESGYNISGAGESSYPDSFPDLDYSQYSAARLRPHRWSRARSLSQRRLNHDSTRDLPSTFLLRRVE